MTSPRKPWWQQATALVSLGAGGAVTGFAFAPGTADQVASPTGIPVMLTALDHAARPAASDDSAVRSAIVSVANYYLRMAQSKTPAEMEALIWQRDSTDGADHGESCAAFASMTLALAAQMVGHQSWVTGGSTYPWPLQDWADVRVDPNPASLGITSILQDAQAHQRWHPLGDGYQPLPGDWVLFDGHVEVVTNYSGGVLSTVGGDSLPNFSVNAHEYPGPLADQGVAGFVSNGNLPTATTAAAASPAVSGSAAGQSAPSARPASSAANPAAAGSGGSGASATQQANEQPAGVLAAVPGTAAMAADTAAVRTDSATIPGLPQAAGAATAHAPTAQPAPPQEAAAPHAASLQAAAHRAAARPAATQGAGGHDSAPGAAIPGMPGAAAETSSGIPSATYGGQQSAGASAAPSSSASRSASSSAPPSASAPPSGPGTPAEQAFIAQVAPGAIAAQRTYGVPASVTIAQAINESAWGQSTLAAQDHNLFGIKGLGPAGGVSFPTQEFQNGQWVTISAQFRAYRDVTQSIEDHGQLLANSGYYTAAMAARTSPDQFAQALTGVYATSPTYGSDLISLMQTYNLYRFDAVAQSSTSPAITSPSATASPSTATTPALATPRATATPRGTAAPLATTRAPRPAAQAATAAPSRPVPHPFATPQTSAPQSPAPASTPQTSAPQTTAPQTSAPQTTAPSAAATAPDQAAIPGILSGPGATSTHTSAALHSSTGTPRPRSWSDTQVVAELAAVYRPMTPSGNPAPAGQAASQSAAPASTAMASATKQAEPRRPPAQKKSGKRKGATAKARKPAPRYRPQMPTPVKNAFLATARTPLARAELLYRDVAGSCGISWKLLAACDWMQCEAHPRYSPVNGEKLGTVNLDGTVFRTKSEALTQCAHDLVDLAGTVYEIDLTMPVELSVLELARVFAAFRWGGLLKLHSTSAMEFPYSVQGLTEQHLGMRWPRIAEPNTPDKPGARFRRPFGAVPVVLSLDYPATI